MNIWQTILRGNGRWLPVVATLTLALTALPPAHAPRAETLKDLITRKLQELNLLEGDSTAPASPGNPTLLARPAVTINDRPAREALSRNDASRTSHVLAVPLPRPRPASLAARQQRLPTTASAATPASPTRTALLTDQAGRIRLNPKQLLQERDHYQAVYLKPKEIGHWDAATVNRVRRNCDIVLAALNVDARPLPSIGGPQGCGIAAPVQVKSLGVARLKPPAKLNCRFTAALYEWVRDVVQPAARKHFGQPVVAIRQLSDYSCRRRGGITRGPVRISEHSFGNAIDIGWFELANGKRIHLLKNWGEFRALFSKKSAFLADVRAGACKYFSTVLSPKYNKAHANHFHFDLGRGGRHGICK